MDPLSIAKIGLGVASFIGGRKDAKANRNAGQLDLGKLRSEAIEHGFNPLTVLNSTGGAGFGRPQVAQGALSMIGQIGGALTNDLYEMSRQKRNDELAGALMGAQTDNLRMQTALMPLSVRPQTGGGGGGEPAHVMKSWEEWGYVDLWTHDGTPIQLHGGIADRLGLKAGDVYLPADTEETLGDIGSVPAQIGGMGDSFWQEMKGWVLGNERPNQMIRRGHSGSQSGTIAPNVQAVPPPMTLPKPKPERIVEPYAVPLRDAPVTDGRPWW